jgi:hypothetical protein
MQHSTRPNPRGFALPPPTAPKGSIVTLSGAAVDTIARTAEVLHVAMGKTDVPVFQTHRITFQT